MDCHLLAYNQYPAPPLPIPHMAISIFITKEAPFNGSRAMPAIAVYNGHSMFPCASPWLQVHLLKHHIHQLQYVAAYLPDCCINVALANCSAIRVRFSGDLNAGVPGQLRMLNTFSLPVMMLLLPKSAILTFLLLLSSSRLAGLRSPCTTLWL
eukprot:GHRR01028074.1.p1 GENE.GHRR01028074.1~~GHRR01028074.1.p1  ORF type:complete len:153 (+),score=31.17 GHRR01028074.1:1722-2180(+)